MPIGNVKDKVSKSTMEKMDKRDNKPSVEPGFEDGMDFSDIFDTMDEEFGAPDSGQTGFTGGANSFGSGDANSFNNTGNSFGGASGLDAFGQPSTMNLGGPINLGGAQAAAPAPVQKKPDLFDYALDVSTEAAKSGGHIIKDMIKSITLRTYDDFAGYSASLTITGGIIAGIGVILGIIGEVSGVGDISFSAFPFDLCIGGGISAALGIAGIGCSALGIIGKDEPTEKLSDLPDIPIQNKALDNFEFEADEELWDSEEEYADMINDVFSSTKNTSEVDNDNVDSKLDLDDFELSISDFDDIKETKELEPDKLLDSLPEHVAALNRQTLYDMFKGFFITNTPGFSTRTELSSSDDEFMGIRATVFEALAAANKQDIDEVETDIESIVSTFFCYEIKVTRIKGLNKLDDIKREVEAYFRDDADDMSVVATVSIERNCYKIVLTKGIKAIITVGDCLKLKEVEDYIRNDGKMLPFIAGIDDYGQPVLADGRNYTTMLIAGKQRSGKSWYVDSIIMAFMTFNSPEDVQFLIIDPKESNLFKTIGCMPHVCGLHTDKNIINILQDIIHKEGDRRKKILADNRCDDIWDLRKRKGIKLPVLYIVIDEFMTVLANLSPNGMDKELVEVMNVIITQLPFVGIHLIFVPHRAQGVVDKTTRAMMTFSAAVRADVEIVKETLDDKKWNRALTQPGDTALRMSDVGITKFVKGAAITTSDSDNMILIENIAKAFYRIGVDIPNMRTIGKGYNRNEHLIKEMLNIGGGDTSYVKYDNDSKGEAPLHASVKDWLDNETDESELFNDASLNDLR